MVVVGAAGIPWRSQTMTTTATTATNDNGPKISQWHGHMEDYDSHKHWFLADRTNGRAYAELLRPSAWRQSVVYLSVVCNVCIVAKRCVLEQKLLLTAQSHIGSRMWGIDWYQNEWPWTLFLKSLLKVTSTNASHSSLNMAKNVRDRGLVPKDYQ